MILANQRRQFPFSQHSCENKLTDIAPLPRQLAHPITTRLPLLPMRPRRLLILTCILVVAAILHCHAPDIPDQSKFAKLKVLQIPGPAVVRIYAAPIPHLGAIAVHTWLVIKSADDAHFDRWEVWQTAAGPHGHLRLNLMPPESDVGAGGTFIVAEIIGPDAEQIVHFIRTQSPTYPCRNRYKLLGPNSNTYPQWILDNACWSVKLPRSAIGKNFKSN